MDISWISAEAKQIHGFFESIFYIVATILILLGVLLEYFKMPIGGMPTFTQLIGRALVACILLISYPEISNTVSAVADGIADHLGSLNHFTNVLESAGSALKQHSWSWTSLGDTLLSVASYAVYLILYLTVFFFDAAIVYCLVLLYIFSPMMIAFYILPQTASLTGGLFRTLFEIATWKIVWCILGTLLWSTALNNFKHSGEGNFITLIALTLMLAFSILLTPIVVRNLISGTLSSVASQTAGLAAVALSAGTLAPSKLAALTGLGTKKAALWTGKTLSKGIGKSYSLTKKYSGKSLSSFSRNFKASPQKSETK